jgi:Protein of unknown function (DUF1579)
VEGVFVGVEGRYRTLFDGLFLDRFTGNVFNFGPTLAIAFAGDTTLTVAWSPHRRSALGCRTRPLESLGLTGIAGSHCTDVSANFLRPRRAAPIDTTEGTVEGQPYWRRGWLGYSNLDRRYEWVTIAPRVPMMIYLGKPGSGDQMPIDVTGVFTDQGVVNEQTVGKAVVQRTVIRIESNDRHVSELYFTPPGMREQLAMRLVYTRIK